jgi:hypothetical protein
MPPRRRNGAQYLKNPVKKSDIHFTRRGHDNASIMLTRRQCQPHGWLQ